MSFADAAAPPHQKRYSETDAAPMDDRATPTTPVELSHPQLRLHGQVNDEMLDAVLRGLAEARDGPLVVELTTTGGDAEAGRRIASDLRHVAGSGRPALFYGKAVVYSAGVTIMSAFPRSARWLAEDTMLLIHCRRIEKTLNLQGPLRAEGVKLRAVLAEIEAGLQLQAYDFERLIEGSDISLDELLERAQDGWYVSAEEALQRGLVGGICRPGG